jgi:hypothetical protein
MTFGFRWLEAKPLEARTEVLAIFDGIELKSGQPREMPIDVRVSNVNQSSTGILPGDLIQVVLMRDERWCNIVRGPKIRLASQGPVGRAPDNVAGGGDHHCEIHGDWTRGITGLQGAVDVKADDRFLHLSIL